MQGITGELVHSDEARVNNMTTTLEASHLAARKLEMMVGDDRANSYGEHKARHKLHNDMIHRVRNVSIL